MYGEKKRITWSKKKGRRAKEDNHKVKEKNGADRDEVEHRLHEGEK